jgi:GT2 family glycosyltransferase
MSVILATCDRRAMLERTLRAYESQQDPLGGFEVVVVDDGSSDGTLEFLRSWHPSHYAFRYATQTRGGPGRARNAALRQAGGDIVFFTGDDIVPTPTLLKCHWEAHRHSRSPFAAFVGFSGWPEGLRLTSTMKHVTGVGAQQFSYHYFKPGAEYDFRHLYTSNFSVRRSVLDLEPTYFSAAFPKAAFEDVELSYRLSFHGMRIYYAQEARAEHHHFFDVRRFFARQVACGEMGAILAAKYPELRKWTRDGEVEWGHLLVSTEALPGRYVTTKVLRHLGDVEERVLRLAGLFDYHHVKPLDALLVAIFDYAYLRGLADARYTKPAAEWVRSFLLKTRVLPEALRFEASCRSLGVLVPRADLERLHEFAR